MQSRSAKGQGKSLRSCAVVVVASSIAITLLARSAISRIGLHSWQRGARQRFENDDSDRTGIASTTLITLRSARRTLASIAIRIQA